MNRLLRWGNGFWFAEAPAVRLGLLRILIGLFALYTVGSHYSMLMSIGRTNTALFAPVGIVAILNEPLSTELLQGIVIACLAANVVFIFGWWHRVTGPVFAGLLLWVLCYRNSWSMIYHSGDLLVLHILVLGLARAADALSIDAWRRFRGANARRQASDWRYGWPIRLIAAITVVAYFLAGVAKVAGPLGWSWATGEALRSQIAADAIRKELLGVASSPLFAILYDQVWLFTILAFGSLVLELGAPLIMLNKHVARVWAVGALMMHWGIYLLMGVTFPYHMSGLAYICFFNVERVFGFMPFASKLGARSIWDKAPSPTPEQATL